ncbi:SLC13 family permease [Desertibaculum subflavum]|uniref:SLC13 family permease n=1 Tax=Desertibaculum subflavum TaxID=2268458 RepID=UPI000E67099F
MTIAQAELFALFAGILGMLLWGRFRHDLVAASGLFLAVLLGLVPEGNAFSGFSNPAVIIVALVLIASRAFENSGALGLMTGLLLREGRSAPLHISIIGGIGAGLSMVINNVAALALLMPLDLQAARKAGRAPGSTLMPLAFATILGGMVTLIGTPPNIIASAVRQEQLGRPYQMFDFAPVGLAVAIAGIAFVALAGWRLVPGREDRAAAAVRESSFKAELLVPEGSRAIGQSVAEIEEDAEKSDLLIIGLIRGRERHYAAARRMIVAADDIVLVEGSTDAIGAFIKSLGLQDAPQEEDAPAEAAADEAEDKAKKFEPNIVEAVVRADSRLAGRSARELALRSRFGITLLGIGHSDIFVRDVVQSRPIAAGDTLLMAGAGASRQPTLDLLGLIPIGTVSVAAPTAWKIAVTVGLFAAAIAAAGLGLVSFTVAIGIAVAGYAAFGLISGREFYQQVEWPVVVMLACLLPIGTAFERLGGTALIADAILELTRGQSAVVALVLLMVVVMTLSDVLNNVATMVIAGPLAVQLAQKLGVNPDTFLMGTAIATSCAFLTPIGHKNNTLIMGPGGFRFADYWPLGLPLEIVVLAVGVPTLLVVWPL